MRVRRVSQDALRTIRAASARLVALGIGLALLAGVLRGGSHFLYCPFMGAVVEEHCCAETREDVSTVQAPDCCQARTIGILPSATSSPPAPAVHAPCLLAVFPAARTAGGDAVTAYARSSLSPPTGPPRVGAKSPARLMVFLI